MRQGGGRRAGGHSLVVASAVRIVVAALLVARHDVVRLQLLMVRLRLVAGVVLHWRCVVAVACTDVLSAALHRSAERQPCETD